MPHDVRTACTRDCPDACQILATVDDGRITRLRGDPDHPVTRGFLCVKGRFGYEFMHGGSERKRRREETPAGS